MAMECLEFIESTYALAIIVIPQLSYFYRTSMAVTTGLLKLVKLYISGSGGDLFVSGFNADPTGLAEHGTHALSRRRKTMLSDPLWMGIFRSAVKPR